MTSSTPFTELLAKTQSYAKSEDLLSVPFKTEELLHVLQTHHVEFQLLFAYGVSLSDNLQRESLYRVDHLLSWTDSQVSLAYRSDLFSESRANEFLFEFEYLITQIIQDPKQVIGKYR